MPKYTMTFDLRHPPQFATSGRERVLTLSRRVVDDMVEISVKDNGVGIPKENLRKIFQHGFTTRSDGHGFGLHGSAIAATQMHGSLSVDSAGDDQGATFVLRVPIRPPGGDQALAQNDIEEDSGTTRRKLEGIPA